MNTGIFSLTQQNGASDLPITIAGTTICDPILSLEGMTAVSLSIRLAYGSGGTTVNAYVQTSLDQGATWVDVASAAFTTASGTEIFNLSGLTAVTAAVTPGDAILTPGTAISGILGDRLRVKVASTGTYGGSTVLSVRAAVR